MSKMRQHTKSGTWWEETTCEPPCVHWTMVLQWHFKQMYDSTS